jgi:hypothetical protein
LTILTRSQIHHGSNANRKAISRSACADLLLEFAQAQTPCVDPRLVSVWSFAVGKTPEVKPHSGFTTGTPDKPEFFAEQKMRPYQLIMSNE